MFTLAITGGIGTGKSTVVKLLMDHYGPTSGFFDSDACVHRLLTKPEIVETIANKFGPAVLAEDGAVDRRILGQRVFSDSEDRGFLESLLHPLVREEGMEQRRSAEHACESDEPAELFIFDVPLLYEVDFDVPRDLDVLIAASPEIQRQRLRDYRQLSDKRIDAILAVQIPIHEKARLAPCVIWNDGTMHELLEQVLLLNQMIEARARRKAQ